jgi:hypothetical protein
MKIAILNYLNKGIISFFLSARIGRFHLNVSIESFSVLITDTVYA